MNVRCILPSSPGEGFGWLRPLCMAVAAIVLTTVGLPASAQQSSLAECVQRVANAARSQGARPSTRRRSSTSCSPATSAPTSTRCRKTAASASSRSGIARCSTSGSRCSRRADACWRKTRARDAHAYARFCGQGGRRFVVEVRMLDGRGRVSSRAAVERAAVARRARADHGELHEHGRPRDPILSTSGRSRSDRPRHRARVGEEQLGVARLSTRRRRARRAGCPSAGAKCGDVTLDGGQCYALAAVGDGDVEDIDMRCSRSPRPRRCRGSDVTRRRDAVVKVCPERAGVYVLDVRMYRGAGNYVVQSFGLSEPQRRPPAGIEGGTRIPYAELLAQLERRGMRVTPVVWGLLQPEGTQIDPDEGPRRPLLRGERGSPRRIRRRRSRHELDRRSRSLARRRHRTEPASAACITARSTTA